MLDRLEGGVLGIVLAVILAVDVVSDVVDPGVLASSSPCCCEGFRFDFPSDDLPPSSSLSFSIAIARSAGMAGFGFPSIS